MFQVEAICFTLYSSPNATLFCECVFSDKNSSWAIVMMMFVVYVCVLIQDRLISVIELELAEVGKPAHLAY